MRPDSYGEQIAEVYDDWFGSSLDSDAAVAFLASKAELGAVLELGVGTGRLALPLADLGLQVTGIDISEGMLAQMRAKAGAEKVRMVHGDMAKGLSSLGTFKLVFIACNGIFGLQTAAEQSALFHAVYDVLPDDGLFVVEAKSPTAKGLSASGEIRVVQLEEDRVLLEASLVNEVDQLIDLQMVELSTSGIRMFPARLRYTFAHELDLMAAAAGFELSERLAGWPSRGESRSAQQADVIVYRKSAGSSQPQ